jgi:hypothetical protein
VADDNDNDDTRQLLLAACRDGDCRHSHHRYTSDDNAHSILNNNMAPAPDPSARLVLAGSGGNGPASGRQREVSHHRASPAADNQPLVSSSAGTSPSSVHHPHYQHHYPRYSSTAHTPQPPRPQHETRASPQEGCPLTGPAGLSGGYDSTSDSGTGRHQFAAKTSSNQSKDGTRHSQKQHQPQQQQQQQQKQQLQLPQQGRDHTPTIRQCSAPTPLYPLTQHCPVPIQQQRSFPEWAPRPRAGILPLFQYDSTTSPPLSAAAAASSSPCYGDDLRHPAAGANTNLLLRRGGGGGDGGRSQGQVEVEEAGGWPMLQGPHAVGKVAALAVSNNNNTATSPAADDDMDSQGHSQTPDSPFRSGDDDGLGEDFNDEDADDDDEDDAMTGRSLRPKGRRKVGSHVRQGSPRVSPTVPQATDTSPSEIEDDGNSCVGGRGRSGGGGDGTSTSVGGVSLSDDASIFSLSDPNLSRSSPSTHPPPPPPRLDLLAAHSPASGEPEPDLAARSPDLDLSHSLSVYETAESRSRSSESAAVSSLPLEAGQASPRRPRPGGGATGGQSPDSSSPDRHLYPDASG